MEENGETSANAFLPEGDRGSEGGEASRKRQHRWNPSRYISLLRIVTLHSPFAASYKNKGASWDRVAEEYNAAIEEQNAITGRKAKEKFDLLLSTFRKEEVESLRRSGTDEEYTELDHLLEELDEMERDARAESEASKDNIKKKVSH